MDPVTAIVGAVAAGALAALKDEASEAVKGAYRRLRDWILGRSDSVDVGALERAPASEARRAVFAEELEAAGLAEDSDLLEQALALADVLRHDDPEAGTAVGVDLEGVRAGNIRITRVRSRGTGVVGKDLTVSGDLTIEDIDAGGTDDPN